MYMYVYVSLHSKVCVDLLLGVSPCSGCFVSLIWVGKVGFLSILLASVLHVYTRFSNILRTEFCTYVWSLQ